jgi:hypothetical protein
VSTVTETLPRRKTVPADKIFLPSQIKILNLTKMKRTVQSTGLPETLVTSLEVPDLEISPTTKMSSSMRKKRKKKRKKRKKRKKKAMKTTLTVCRTADHRACPKMEEHRVCLKTEEQQACPKMEEQLVSLNSEEQPVCFQTEEQPVCLKTEEQLACPQTEEQRVSRKTEEQRACPKTEEHLWPDEQQDFPMSEEQPEIKFILKVIGYLMKI